jgi:hypothetical protein
MDVFDEWASEEQHEMKKVVQAVSSTLFEQGID